MLRSTRRSRAGAGAAGVAAAELPLSLLAASEDCVWAGAVPTTLAAAAAAGAVVRAAARGQRDRHDGSDDAAGDPEGGDERAQGEAPARASRALESALDALIQARPERGRDGRRLGAHVAHERCELGLGGAITGEGGLERLELGGHGGIEGGLTTAHDRPLEVG